MPSAEPAISLDRAVKIYTGGMAVNGISFAVEVGSVTALLGGNGAGKTTTIAMIMGLVTPTSGRVTVLGAEMPRQRHRVLHRMNFESPYVDMPMRLTVWQNLKVFGARWIAFPKRPNNGAVLAGTVESVEQVGPLYQAKVKQGSAADSPVVTLVSAKDPQVAAGDEVLALGTIVEKPAETIAGYQGADPSVVWSGMALKLPPAAK